MQIITVDTILAQSVLARTDSLTVVSLSTFFTPCYSFRRKEFGARDFLNYFYLARILSKPKRYRDSSFTLHQLKGDLLFV